MKILFTSILLILLGLILTAGIIIDKQSKYIQVKEIVKTGHTPYYEKKFKPQGLCFISDSSFLLTVHHDDMLTTAHEIDMKSLESIREFKLPPSATHTSGLTMVDSNTLVAVDYNDNNIYVVNLQKSFSEKKASIIEKTSTSLKGTSSVCYFSHNNKNYLAVSEFMRSKRTYILDYDRLIKTRSFDEAVVATYKNGWFSQGLTFHNGNIYETTNSIFGNSVLEIRTLTDVLNENNEVIKVSVPAKGIEDIDIKDGWFFTTDEKTFEYVKFTLDEH